MSRTELQENRSYQVKYYEGYHCVERSCVSKTAIEQLLNENKSVEVYDAFHYEKVR